jgi:hypothetical protein
MKASKLFSCSALTAFLIGTVAQANVVTDWNNAALDAIRADHTSPPIASRRLAILHVSIYDAVNGIARTHEPYLVQSEVPASASREAAANAAAHQALVNLFPASTSTFDALHAAILATIPDGPQKAAGIVWGEFVANQILAARANDGSDAVVPPPGGSGPGVWIPTPPAIVPFVAAMGIRHAVCNEQQLPIPSTGPAASRQRAVRGKLRRGQSARRSHWLDAHGRTDRDCFILG